MKNKFLLWIFGCFTITLLIGFSYVSLQQIIRLTANDPQIQMANDIASNINSGKGIREVIEAPKVDIMNSSSPFVIIYDSKYNVIASSGMVLGNMPKETKPPVGVFEHIKPSLKDYRFSWEPVSSFRYAAVLRYTLADRDGKEFYVLVAKSLGLTEQREDLILQFAAVSWLIGISFTSIIFLFLWKDKK